MIAYRAPQDGQAGRPTEQPAAHRHCPRGENWQTRHLEGVVLRERLTGSRPVAGTRSKAPVAELVIGNNKVCRMGIKSVETEAE